MIITVTTEGEKKKTKKKKLGLKAISYFASVITCAKVTIKLD